LLLTVLLLAGAAGLVWWLLDPGNPATLANDCRRAVEEPERVVLECANGSAYADGLEWQGWGERVARAEGVARVSACEPRCPEGALQSYPVRLEASGIRSCPGNERRYTRLRYSLPDGSPLPFADDRPRRRLRFSCAGAVRPRSEDQGRGDAAPPEPARRPEPGTEDELDSGRRDSGDQRNDAVAKQLEATVPGVVATEAGQDPSRIERIDCDEVEPDLYRCKYEVEGFPSLVEVEVDPSDPSNFEVLPNQ
jgi:hypothetical protein